MVNCERLYFIDGVRAISCIIVLLSHLICAFGIASPTLQTLSGIPVIRLLFDGHSAVHVFILISAFLFFKKGHNMQKSGLNRALLKRYLRLTLPVLFVSVIVLILKISNLLFHQQVALTINNAWLLIDVQQLNNFYKSVLFTAIYDNYGWINVLWMLKYVFWGTIISLILGMCLRACTLRNQLLILFICFVFAFSFDTHYGSVIVGCFFSFINQNQQHFSCSNKMTKLLLAGCLLLLLYEEFAWPYFFAFFRRIFIAVLIFSIIFFSSSIKRFLSIRWLHYLDKISFPIYLFQLPVIYSFSCGLFLCFPRNEMYIAIICCSTIILTIIVSCLYFIYIEPLINKLINVI